MNPLNLGQHSFYVMEEVSKGFYVPSRETLPKIKDDIHNIIGRVERRMDHSFKGGVFTPHGFHSTGYARPGRGLI